MWVCEDRVVSQIRAINEGRKCSEIKMMERRNRGLKLYVIWRKRVKQERKSGGLNKENE